jgi:hypothetical protein
MHYKKTGIESGGGWIEYVTVVITAATCLSTVITAAAFSI